jgi:hypothetical protein
MNSSDLRQLPKHAFHASTPAFAAANTASRSIQMTSANGSRHSILDAAPHHPPTWTLLQRRWSLDTKVRTLHPSVVSHSPACCYRLPIGRGHKRPTERLAVDDEEVVH